ncbi:Pectinesterase inhibitor domain containing protein [Parasponia andersonii]|uniref:Pectinesterase n=1 Tax=Parasponia andersonii TaxID=3476 RepID=A0A2P5DGR3_PARAD|nr:Pectinesterase inhibitor domain containing protein [Parasponia andersonii]
MSSLLFLSIFLISLSSAHHSRTRHALVTARFANSAPPQTPDHPAVQQACKATRFQEQCEASLCESGRVLPRPDPVQIIQAAIGVSAENLQTANRMARSILESSAGNLNRTTAALNCLEFLRNSDHRTRLANEALPRGRTKDARAWMSAALLYQYDCWSALKYANDTRLVNETMSFLDSLIGLSSNALSIMASYDEFGNDTSTWAPPRTERDGFWAGSGSGSELGSRGGFPSKLTADATVCKDGSGGEGFYKTVQEAVNAAPDNGVKRFVIHIKGGVYEESVRVPLEKKNVVFLGDGIGKTVITGSLNAGQPGVSTYNTPTVGVFGDGFMAYGLTIQNTAGPDAHQAVAFRSDSDLSVIESCEFVGNTDTLYAHSLRQFYKSCRIQGTIDFIFGNSASIFQDCEILIRPRPEEDKNNIITAHGRTDPAQSTGFVFQNCLINGTEEYMKLHNNKPQLHKNYLGRPWKEYSRTVFIHCNLESLITPEGWLPWREDFALKTLFYGEFGNSGAGSDLSRRVSWSNKIPAEHVNIYSIQSFIQGDEWISTK